MASEIARRTSASLLATLAVCSAFAVSCATRKVTVYKDTKLTVQLLSRRGEAPGFGHPITIAPVRLAHILARIDIRTGVKDGQRRVPGIPLETLEAISQGLSKGLSEAHPDQRVTVVSIRTAKRYGLFNHDYLTSFVAYVNGNTLFLHLSRSDWEVPLNREKRLPQPEVGVFPTKFRIVASRSMELLDKQALAIDWRDSIFDRPSRTRVSPGGKLMRRTILMEDQSDDAALAGDDEVESKPVRPKLVPIPSGVSPDTLRALADLEERRRRGTITEAQYAQQRLVVLEAEASR